MDIKKIITFLNDTKIKLDNLEDTHHSGGIEELERIKSQIKMVIRRIYPDAQAVEKKLLPPLTYVSGGFDSDHQKYFVYDVKTTARAVDTILKEHELFGFDDFTPLKEREETEWQVGSDKIGFIRKKRTK